MKRVQDILFIFPPSGGHGEHGGQRKGTESAGGSEEGFRGAQVLPEQRNTQRVFGFYHPVRKRRCAFFNTATKPRSNNLNYVFFVLCASPSSSRCFGGQVSWDKSVCIGSTYDVTDETITHQIVDRPNVDKQYINRYLLISAFKRLQCVFHTFV